MAPLLPEPDALRRGLGSRAERVFGAMEHIAKRLREAAMFALVADLVIAPFRGKEGPIWLLLVIAGSGVAMLELTSALQRGRARKAGATVSTIGPAADPLEAGSARALPE